MTQLSRYHRHIFVGDIAVIQRHEERHMTTTLWRMSEMKPEKLATFDDWDAAIFVARLLL